MVVHEEIKMEYRISNEEKLYLRELAKKQIEYAKLPVMEERARNWVNLNTGKPFIPPIIVETWTFDPYILPDSIFKCNNPAARNIEYVLLKNIREHELINDDKVMPGVFHVDYLVDIDYFGVPVDEIHARDQYGDEIAFVYNHPINDLEKEFYKLKSVSIKNNKPETEKLVSFTHDVLGDIIPVKMRGQPPIVGLTWHAVQLMGMEALFLAIYDQPEAVHKLMRYLTDNLKSVLQFLETEGLLTHNTGNNDIGLGSYGFLGGPPKNGNATLKEVWAWVEAEETSPISPEMFKEFFLPYVKEVAGLIGFVYYGCCEPLQNVWPAIIKAIPNIKKVSISPFCDEQIMGDYLRGTNVVFSRKPCSNYLGVKGCWDEEQWRNHIRQTARAARGCQYEIIMRDLYRIDSLESVKNAVEIAREEILNSL